MRSRNRLNTVIPTGRLVKHGGLRLIPDVLNVGLIGLFTNFNVECIALGVDKHGMRNRCHFHLDGKVRVENKRPINGAVEILLSRVVPGAHVRIAFPRITREHKHKVGGNYTVVRIQR